MSKPPFIQRQERRRQLERLRAERNERELSADAFELHVTDDVLQELLALNAASRMLPPGRLQ